MGKRFKDLGIKALRGQLGQIDPSNAVKIAKFQQRINDLETGKVKVGDPHTSTQVAVPKPEPKKKKEAPADLNRKQRRAKLTEEYNQKEAQKTVKGRENKANNEYIEKVVDELLTKKMEKNEVFLDGYDSENEEYNMRLNEMITQVKSNLSGSKSVKGIFGFIPRNANIIKESVEEKVNSFVNSYREGGQSVIAQTNRNKLNTDFLEQQRLGKGRRGGRERERGINTFVSHINRRKQFKYEARETFNQPNADKFGLKDDGTPRSRREFAHRFRGKTEAEVSKMIDQEVKDRTPEQRGAFVGRASRELEGQDITNDGVLQVGGNRIGAGEFIASQLAKKDIEQIEPKAKGFVGSEFTPENMRRMGAMSKDEVEKTEGLVNIKKRREQQYQKEWSADGTTLRNYGFGVLDQEFIQSVKERNDAMLNAVAESIQLLTQGKEPDIEEDEFDKIYNSTEKTRADLKDRRFGGIKPLSREDVKKDLNEIQTNFVSSDAYIQAQNNYALQNRFVDVFEKEPNTLQYLQSMKDANGKDFKSRVGYRSVNYVDTSLTMYKEDPSVGNNPYLDRFNILIGSGREPLQFILNTANNSILKFKSDEPIAQEGIYNGVGNIAVMNEVMLGGRVAFIGHTGRGADPTVVSGATQQGSALGYGIGFINVFNNPYDVEENGIKPLIEQNKIVPMTSNATALRGIYNISTRDTSFAGVKDLTGGNITLKETGVRKTTARGETVQVETLLQGGQSYKRPRPTKATPLEKIRKGTYLPTKRAYETTTEETRNKLRQAQLKANSFPTVALGKRKIFGFQMLDN